MTVVAVVGVVCDGSGAGLNRGKLAGARAVPVAAVDGLVLVADAARVGVDANAIDLGVCTDVVDASPNDADAAADADAAPAAGCDPSKECSAVRAAWCSSICRISCRPTEKEEEGD